MKAHLNKVNSLFGGKFLMYQPGLSYIFESIPIGLLLSSLIYWHGMGAKKNYVYKTVKDMLIETGLSENQQRSAIRRCVELEILTVELKGIPAKRHFQLHIDTLIKYITRSEKIMELLLLKYRSKIEWEEGCITESTQIITVKVRSIYEKCLKEFGLSELDALLNEKRMMQILARCIDTDYQTILRAVENAARYPDSFRSNGRPTKVSIDNLFKFSDNLITVANYQGG